MRILEAQCKSKRSRETSIMVQLEKRSHENHIMVLLYKGEYQYEVVVTLYYLRRGSMSERLGIPV